ncbi:hypothetical protein ACJJTC_012740 [Scirpophaga incertulas]
MRYKQAKDFDIDSFFFISPIVDKVIAIQFNRKTEQKDAVTFDVAASFCSAPVSGLQPSWNSILLFFKYLRKSPATYQPKKEVKKLSLRAKFVHTSNLDGYTNNAIATSNVHAHPMLTMHNARNHAALGESALCSDYKRCCVDNRKATTTA